MNAEDYAFLVLKKRIGQETGYFGRYAVSDSHGNLLQPRKFQSFDQFSCIIPRCGCELLSRGTP